MWQVQLKTKVRNESREKIFFVLFVCANQIPKLQNTIIQLYSHIIQDVEHHVLNYGAPYYRWCSVNYWVSSPFAFKIVMLLNWKSKFNVLVWICNILYQLKMKASGFKTKKRTKSDCLREVISMWLIIKAYCGSWIFTTIPISYKYHEYRIWRKS